MSDLLRDKKRRELALQIRYLMVNIAAVSGPLIGIVFGLNSQKRTFFFTALSYVSFFLFVVLRIPAIKIQGDIKLKDKINTELDTWHVIRIISKRQGLYRCAD